MTRTLFVVLFSCFFASLATAQEKEPATDNQIKELKKLSEVGRITSAELEGFLATHRPKINPVVVSRPYPVTVMCDWDSVVRDVCNNFDFLSRDLIYAHGQGIGSICPRGYSPHGIPDNWRRWYSDCKAGPAEMRVFQFSDAVFPDDAEAEMNRQGYRPATLQELLALDTAWPDLRRQFSIIAIGSQTEWPQPFADPRHYFAPFVSGFDGKRHLDHQLVLAAGYYGGTHWSLLEGFRFAAVRKASK